MNKPNTAGFRPSDALRPALLTSASALSVMCALPFAALAQDAEDENVETIVVTGIRGALSQSMDVKRDSFGVVDAISAEDIGKFPDTNLAESLQRITGVSIDRVNGEGSEVTVRGFGGGFNLVTLNGRQLPAANVATITGNSDDVNAEGTSRSFDFSSLASEGVRGIQVYKTGRADSPSGGIGAVLNLQTIRPLSAETQGSIGVKAVHDTSGSDDITPEVSGLYSWASDSNKVGVSVFGSYQERSSGARVLGTSYGGFFDYSPDLGFLSNAEVVNAPAVGSLMTLQNNISINTAQIERERINGMATFQFAPSDATTFTADALYTSNELSQRNLVPGIWYSRQFDYVEFDGSDIVATPIALVETIAPPDGRGKDLFYASFADDTKDETTALGFNVEHQFNDSFSIMFDAATSTAEAGGNGPRGHNSWRFNVAAAGAGWQAATYEGGVPTATVGVVENTGPAGGNGNGVLDAGDIATQTLTSIKSSQETNIDQFKLAGSWDKGEGLNVDFGVGYITQEMKHKDQEFVDFLGGWGVGVNDIPDPSLLTQVDTTAQFNDLALNGYPNADAIAPPGYVYTVLGREAFQVDPFSFASSLSPYTRADGSIFDIDNIGRTAFSDNIIEEDIFSAFVSAEMEGEIAGLPLMALVGVRYEHTDVTSNTLQNVPTVVTWTSDNDFRTNFSEDLVTLAQEHSYDNVLPNIDVAVDVLPDVKARASMSQTIARPAYNDMFITTTVATPPTLTLLGGVPTATRGVATLDPLESTNFDASLEWYYDDSSYVSVGYFRKAVNNFVGTTINQGPLFGLTDPTSGAAGTLTGQAQQALIDQGWAVNEQNMFTMAAILANPDDFPGGADDFLDPSEPGGAQQALDIIALYDIDGAASDPLLNFDISEPVNNETAIIDGMEFALQHFFGDTGFGVQANVTIVNGDVGYDVTADPTLNQFALLGLSNTANIVGIYENDRMSARVAYNWRDEFLQETARNQGMPVFVDEFQQLDFNVSYNVRDNLALSLDGINVTKEGQFLYSRTRNMMWANAEGDARYVFGLRYDF